MLYPSGSDANMGLFQAILTDEDAVISDQLNHGSCIDGMRLSKAQRHRYTSSHLQFHEQGFSAARGQADALPALALKHLMSPVLLVSAQYAGVDMPLLCRYVHADMEDLEETLQQTKDARLRLIVTDGQPLPFESRCTPYSSGLATYRNCTQHVLPSSLLVRAEAMP